MRTLTRREFLAAMGGATALLLVRCSAPGPVPKTGDLPTPTTIGLRDASREMGRDAAVLTLDTVPRDEILITPNDEFYVQHFADAPRVDPAKWSLTIDGLVEHPLTLTYDDIRALPAVEEMRTLECIGNPVGGNLIGNAVWKGFYLDVLLKEVGVRPEAVRAKFTAADGYQTSVDLEWITQPGVLMAYEMNGEPLPMDHGFPLRILMPGLYGQKMPKWIQRIEFIDHVFTGFWEKRGWSDVAAVQTNSKIVVPPKGAKLAPGTHTVFGVAFAGKRRIVKVEVGIDGEEWWEAELLHGPSPLVWTQWYFDWEAEELGRHKLFVRATDEMGFRQHEIASRLLSAFPDGSDGIHNIVVHIG